jgi:hypothetical protein
MTKVNESSNAINNRIFFLFSVENFFAMHESKIKHRNEGPTSFMSPLQKTRVRGGGATSQKMFSCFCRKYFTWQNGTTMNLLDRSARHDV